MTRILVLGLVVLVLFLITGCGIPDLPGPIGIPGI